MKGENHSCGKNLWTGALFFGLQDVTGRHFCFTKPFGLFGLYHSI